MRRLRQTGIEQGGVVTGNKEVGLEKHMANNNKDKPMCSDTKQTWKHQTITGQTRISGGISDTGLNYTD